MEWGFEERDEETLKEREREDVTVFESGEAFVGNLELKRGEKGSRVVEDGDVGDVHSTHAADVAVDSSLFFSLLLSDNEWMNQSKNVGNLKNRTFLLLAGEGLKTPKNTSFSTPNSQYTIYYLSLSYYNFNFLLTLNFFNSIFFHFFFQINCFIYYYLFCCLINLSRDKVL